jgi:membrane protein
MANRFARFKKWRKEAQSIWDDSLLRSQRPLTGIQKFAHFWVLVWKSFARNRCPVRASALAYVSLLALVPMLAVVMSITSTFLKKEGEEQIDAFIVKFVSSVIPPATLAPSTNETPDSVSEPSTNLTASTQETTTNQNATITSASSQTNNAGLASLANDERTVRVRKEVARSIHKFIQNTRSGALGITGSVLLIFAAISMLSRIEDTFNDIWGVARGRSWFTRIVLYWGVITLAPLLLAVALGLSSGPHLNTTRLLIARMPFVGNLVFKFLPVVLLCLTFGLFYILMPNTKVQWRAAAVGGLVGGLLFHVNNLVSVLYVSRVVTNSKIYGSLALVPVFMVGLYFAWLILLFGAQVGYAFQNRQAYLEEKQVENINQRGREFIALRLMTFIGQRFLIGDRPAFVSEMGQELCVPTRLIQHVMQTLLAARLVVEASGAETAYVPARPLENISVHDVLMAMRAAQGQPLTAVDEPVRNEVYGEFTRIEEAERAAASSVTLLSLANRAQAKQLATPTTIPRPEPT